MECLKSLFITHAYPPLNYPRSVQISHLVQYLRKSIDITVMASHPNVNSELSLLQFTPLDNIIYPKRTNFRKFFDHIGGHRIKINFFPDTFYPESCELYASSYAFLQQAKCQSIVTFGQPMSVHIAGLKLKKKFPHLRWIAHFSDPWVDNPYNIRNAWVHYLNRKYQDQVFKYADRLLFTSPETINLIMKNYKEPIRKKAFYLPHSFNTEVYPSTNLKEGPITMRYLGNFYGNRQPYMLLEALNILKLRGCLSELFKVDLIGPSSSYNDIIKKLGLENTVTVKPPITYLDSLKVMSETHMLLVIDAPMETSPFFPSKLVDYIGANRPIFGITPLGTSKRIIEELGFLTAHPDDPQEIAENLLEMIRRIRNDNYQIKPKIRSQFSIENVGALMEQFFI